MTAKHPNDYLKKLIKIFGLKGGTIKYKSSEYKAAK